MKQPFRMMGVVNVTPDSFSDGGLFLDAIAAIAHARELIGEGADIVDVGGESTRPGAEPVSDEEELRRVLPVIEGIVAADIAAQVSIDTSKASVARACIDAGATLVNDVSALRADPEMAALIAESGTECCLMHMRGEPRTMQVDRRYADVVGEVRDFLSQRAEFAIKAGIEPARIILDPGIGFGKAVEHNLALLGRIEELVAIGFPILVGTSRKSFLGRITGRPTDARVAATVATCVMAFERGATHFRVHDVAPVADALAVAAATVSGRWKTTPMSSTSPRT